MQVVRIDNNGRALEHVVHVSKSANDEVMFVALGGGPWKVTFDKAGHTPAGSPFNEATYIVQIGGVVKTGGPKATAVVGTYKYNVRNANTDVITNDPDIDIEG
jgi:hypothetical protein